MAFASSSSAHHSSLLAAVGLVATAMASSRSLTRDFADSLLVLSNRSELHTRMAQSMASRFILHGDIGEFSTQGLR
jgi:hypothetical protein